LAWDSSYGTFTTKKRDMSVNLKRVVRTERVNGKIQGGWREYDEQTNKWTPDFFSNPAAGTTQKHDDHLRTEDIRKADEMFRKLDQSPEWVKVWGEDNKVEKLEWIEFEKDGRTYRVFAFNARDEQSTYLDLVNRALGVEQMTDASGAALDY